MGAQALLLTYKIATAASTTFGTTATYKGTNVNLSNGNLTTTMNGTGVEGQSYLTVINSGKKYVEFKLDNLNAASSSYLIIGLGDISTVNKNQEMGRSTDSWGYWNSAGTSPGNGKVHDYNGSGGFVSFGVSAVTNDIIMLAYDATNSFIYVGKNNTWMNSGDPTSGATGTGAMYGSVTGSLTFGVSMFSTSGSLQQVTLQSTLTYTPPTGYTQI